MLAILPVWLTPWFPTQDGPSHFYNAQVLVRYADTANTVLRATFVPHLGPFPNWTAFLLLMLFGQRVVLSLCILAIPAATLYLQKSFKPAADATALLGVMLGYSYLLFMGFFNFVLGCALFAVVAGFWWRHRAAPRWLALYALLAVTWFTHGLAFAAALLALALFIVLERRWRALAALVPAFAIAALDAWPRLGGVHEYRSFGWHLERLKALGPFAFFNDLHVYLASAVTIVVVLLLVALRRPLPAPMLLTAAFVLLFFVSPWGGPHVGWMCDRFLMLAVMTLPAWLPARRGLLAVMLLLTALHVGLTWRDVHTLSRGIAQVARCRAAIPNHTTLDAEGEAPALTSKLQPLRHAPAYLAAGRDVAWLGDYEAELEDFPVRFRYATHPPAGYLLVWRGARGEETEVCRGDDFRLLRREPLARSAKPGGP